MANRYSGAMGRGARRREQALKREEAEARNAVTPTASTAETRRIRAEAAHHAASKGRKTND